MYSFVVMVCEPGVVVFGTKICGVVGCSVVRGTAVSCVVRVANVWCDEVWYHVLRCGVFCEALFVCGVWGRCVGL